MVWVRVAGMVAPVDVAGRLDDFTNKLWAFSNRSSSKASEKLLNSLGLRPRFGCVPWFFSFTCFLQTLLHFQKMGLDKKFDNDFEIQIIGRC